MQNNYYNINQEVIFRHTLNGNTSESLIKEGKITGIREGQYGELLEITFNDGETTYLSERKLSILRLNK